MSEANLLVSRGGGMVKNTSNHLNKVNDLPRAKLDPIGTSHYERKRRNSEEVFHSKTVL